MIISNLNYLETVSEQSDVEGGSPSLTLPAININVSPTVDINAITSVINNTATAISVGNIVGATNAIAGVITDNTILN